MERTTANALSAVLHTDTGAKFKVTQDSDTVSRVWVVGANADRVGRALQMRGYVFRKTPQGVLVAGRNPARAYVPSYGSGAGKVYVAQSSPHAHESVTSTASVPGRSVYAWTQIPLSAVHKPHQLFRPMDQYRTANWGRAVLAACTALSNAKATSDAIRTLNGNMAGFSRTERRAALSLLKQPIKMSENYPRLTNGQHRVQAMVEQKVPFVLVLVDRSANGAVLGKELLVVDSHLT